MVAAGGFCAKLQLWGLSCRRREAGLPTSCSTLRHQTGELPKENSWCRALFWPRVDCFTAFILKQNPGPKYVNSSRGRVRPCAGPEHSGECRLSRPRLPTKGVNAPPPPAPKPKSSPLRPHASDFSVRFPSYADLPPFRGYCAHLGWVRSAGDDFFDLPRSAKTRTELCRDPRQ